MTISILSLHTYPVKSCGGITHTQVNICATGLAHDREWVVVDEAGRFLTHLPHLSLDLIHPAHDATPLYIFALEISILRISLRQSVYATSAVPIRIWISDTLEYVEADMAG